MNLYTVTDTKLVDGKIACGTLIELTVETPYCVAARGIKLNFGRDMTRSLDTALGLFAEGATIITQDGMFERVVQDELAEMGSVLRGYDEFGELCVDSSMLRFTYSNGKICDLGTSDVIDCEYNIDSIGPKV